MDVLSDVLRCVRLTGSMFFLVNASMPWITKAPAASVFASAVLPAAQHLISYHVITEGHCWAGLEGEVPQRLEAGDILVVPHGDPYMLSASPETRAELADEEALRFFRSMAAGELPSVVVEGGGGPETTNFICGFLGCDARPFNPILAALPRVLYLRGATERGGRMSHLVEFALCELRERRSGSREVLLRLSELMFIETVRCHLASALEAEAGWFVGLRDPMVARVLARLHAEPERGWTLDALADDVAASRSVLAERFTRLVGQPPMHYLKAWRMQLAARMLMDRSAKVRTVAEAVGYESEAAFSRAFKRLAGSAPTQYRESFPEKGFVRFA
ncbi:MAG: AraC family transcriptional regulator [Variovorax sp.]|nr:MAG: AraC family transcriptional regulator [Variovorax sp.]